MSPLSIALISTFTTITTTFLISSSNDRFRKGLSPPSCPLLLTNTAYGSLFHGSSSPGLASPSLSCLFSLATCLFSPLVPPFSLILSLSSSSLLCLFISVLCLLLLTCFCQPSSSSPSPL